MPHESVVGKLIGTVTRALETARLHGTWGKQGAAPSDPRPRFNSKLSQHSAIPRVRTATFAIGASRRLELI